MPRKNVTHFQNAFTRNNVGSGPLPDTRNLQLHSVPVSEHSICNAEGKLTGKPFIEDVEQDEDPRIFPAFAGAFTSGLATCAAICVYGWKQQLHHQNFATRSDCWIAMAHVSSAWLSTLDECLALLKQQEVGCRYFRTCIIGGMDGCVEDELQELQDHLASYVGAADGGIECLVTPLLDAQGGAAAVYASEDGIAFHIYDQTPDTAVHRAYTLGQRLPPITQLPQGLTPPLPTLLPQPNNCPRCGIQVSATETLCFICKQFYM